MLILLHIRICTNIHIDPIAHTKNISLRIHIRIFVYMHVFEHTNTICMHIHTHIHPHTRAYTQIHTHTLTNKYTCACTDINTCVRDCVCKYRYAYFHCSPVRLHKSRRTNPTHARTHTHTHTHTHTRHEPESGCIIGHYRSVLRIRKVDLRKRAL